MTREKHKINEVKSVRNCKLYRVCKNHLTIHIHFSFINHLINKNQQWKKKKLTLGPMGVNFRRLRKSKNFSKVSPYLLTEGSFEVPTSVKPWWFWFPEFIRSTPLFFRFGMLLNGKWKVENEKYDIPYLEPCFFG